MTDRPTSAYRALASASRVALIHALQQSGEPLGVDALAARVGLHINTTREHLERLVDAGFVVREREMRGTRGRPRTLYTAAPDPGEHRLDERFRRQLLAILVAGYGRAMASPTAEAERAGRRWVEGVLAANEATGMEPHGGDRSLEQLAALELHLDELGLDPELEPDRSEVHLRRCPFLDLVRQNEPLVCSVHLGIARGILAAHEGPLTVDRLQPFVTPDRCTLYLARRAAQAAESRA